jgi:tetraacyldisaccharide 4'-kinase
MTNRPQRLRYWLWPFSVFYGAGVLLRNILFDSGLLREQTYPVPVICVGNLAAGGSGKTPMTEYLLRLLEGKYRVAVLSRGYRRKTSGFLLATPEHTAEDIGDECFQIKNKYPQATVAIDGNRRRGIFNLLSLHEGVRPEVILMDDGFQHRRVQPSFSILLTDFRRIYCHDRLLPVGRLREPARAAVRANAIIVSKCDAAMKSIESRIIRNEINLKQRQLLFFSCIACLPFRGIFPEAAGEYAMETLRETDEILLLTGIAAPQPLIEEVKKHTAQVRTLSFADHHAFQKRDIRKIAAELEKMAPDALILSTEKDAARLRSLSFLPEEWRGRMYYVPIETRILFDRGHELDELILRHIRLTEASRILQK